MLDSLSLSGFLSFSELNLRPSHIPSSFQIFLVRQGHANYPE